MNEFQKLVSEFFVQKLVSELPYSETLVSEIPCSETIVSEIMLFRNQFLNFIEQLSEQ